MSEEQENGRTLPEPVFAPLEQVHLDRIERIEREVFSQPWRRYDFARMISNPGAVNLVMLVEGQVAGYSCSWTVLDQAELGNIAVAPPWQGRGLGRLLLEESLLALRARGVATVFLEVRRSNLRAFELYRSRGFQRVGVRCNYYTHPVEDALVMRLELADGPPPAGPDPGNP